MKTILRRIAKLPLRASVSSYFCKYDFTACQVGGRSGTD